MATEAERLAAAVLPRADAGALEVSGSDGRAARGRHSGGLTREAPANAAVGQHVRPRRPLARGQRATTTVSRGYRLQQLDHNSTHGRLLLTNCNILPTGQLDHN